MVLRDVTSSTVNTETCKTQDTNPAASSPKVIRDLSTLSVAAPAAERDSLSEKYRVAERDTNRLRQQLMFGHVLQMELLMK